MTRKNANVAVLVASLLSVPTFLMSSGFAVAIAVYTPQNPHALVAFITLFFLGVLALCANVFALLYCMVVTATNESWNAEKKFLWLASLLALNFLALPLYWYFELREDKP